MSLGDLPLVLTVEEAAAALRLSRSTAYELCSRYEATNGREGLPVVRLGRRMRVPRHALERLLNVGEHAHEAPEGEDDRRKD